MTRRDIATFGSIALVALGLRVGYITVQSAFRMVDATFDAADAQLYLSLARGILDGDGMMLHGQPTGFVGPVYPLFLAALLGLGADVMAIGLVQALLGSLTCLIAGMIAFELARDRGWPRPQARSASITASAVAAVYPHFVFWTGYVITETLFVALLSAAFLTLLVAIQRRDPLLGAAAGVLAGAAALTRPAYLGFVVLVIIWWLLRERSTRNFAAAIAFAFAFALPVGGWGLRNAVELGAPVLTSTESGFVMYAGNARTGTGGSRGYLDGKDYPQLEVPAGLSESQIDAFYMRAAITEMIEDPGLVVRKWPSKLWNMWRPTYEGASLRNGVISIVAYLPVLAFGLLGAVQLARRGFRSVGALPILFIGYWAVAHVLIAGLIRYRLPAELILITAGAVAVTGLLARHASGDLRSRTGTSVGTIHTTVRDAT